MTVDVKELRKKIADFCDGYEYPEEAKNTFLSVYDAIGEKESLKNEFFASVQKYADGKKTLLLQYIANPTGCSLGNRMAKELSISTYTADFVICLAWIPFLEKRYEKKGIDKQIFYDGMIDFRCKLWECKRVYDVWGSFVAGWFTGWFTMGRFAFGRLQFEPKRGLWFSKTLKSEDGKKHFLFLWCKFLNMHIPSMGPLDHDQVVDSYKRAYAFFRERGYGKAIVYHTASWLLSPDHEKMFDKNSNIVRFLSDFSRFNIMDEITNNDFWRIYNRPYDAKNPDCSGDTTMQKGYAEIIGKGGRIKHASGVFVYDGERFYK